MSKKLLFLVLAVTLALGGQLAATGTPEKLSGTWYGGSTAADGSQHKWIYVFAPAGPDRWTLTCERAFAAEVFGAALATQFGGEIRKVGSGYELRLVCLATNDTSATPKDLPTLLAARAVVTIKGPDELMLTYDTLGAWKWGTTPFVDQPVAWMYRRGINPPTVETLHRLKMDVEVALQ